MKKFVIGFVFCLLLIGCNNSTDIDPIKRVYMSEVLEKHQIVVLVSKMEDGTGVVFRRTAYIRDLSDFIYYIPDIPLEIWDDYFKDVKKGDTIRFY